MIKPILSTEIDTIKCGKIEVKKPVLLTEIKLVISKFPFKPMPFHNRKFELSPRLKSGVGRGYTQNQILKFSAVICLILAIGLSLNAANLIFRGSNKTNPQATDPQVLGATDTQTNNSPASIQFGTYTVQKGDTLFNISQKINISWGTLATINNLKSPFYLKPGQTIKIPKQ